MFSSSVVAYSGIAAFSLTYVIRYLSYQLSVRSKLPIAPPSEADFFWGHEYKVAQGEVGVEYSRWTALLGSVYRIKAALFQNDIVVISDHLAVQHIFQNAYNYIKSPAFQPIVVKVVGRGVVWAEDEEHKFQRRLVAPAFTPSAVNGMAQSVLQCAEKTVQRMASEIDSSKGNGVFNLCQYIPACTLEIIGRVGFNYDFGPSTPEGKAILDAWYTDVALFSTFPAFVAPIVIGIFPWISKLPIKELHEDSTAKKVIHQVGRKLMQQPISSDGLDIFSILVRESLQEKESGQRLKLDDNTLLDNILSFFMAGFETTSGVIQLTLLDLAQNLEAQSKLREELLNAEFTPNVLENLPYLDAVAREAVRLHPTARDTHRVAVHDDVIPLRNPVTLPNGTIINSIPVKAGDGFTIPFTVLNTNPKVWGANAHEFKPERWLMEKGVPAGSDLPRGPYANVSSFIDGPRTCIGWRLAVMEIKFVLAVLIKSFEFKDTGVKVDKIISPAVQPFVNGVPAQLPVHITPIHA